MDGARRRRAGPGDDPTPPWQAEKRFLTPFVLPLIQSLLDNPSASTSWLHFPGGRYRINDSLPVTRNRKKITGEGSISDGAASLAGVTELVYYGNEFALTYGRPGDTNGSIAFLAHIHKLRRSGAKVLREPVGINPLTAKGCEAGVWKKILGAAPSWPGQAALFCSSTTARASRMTHVALLLIDLHWSRNNQYSLSGEPIYPVHIVAFIRLLAV